jgi:hypothetical protein
MESSRKSSRLSGPTVGALRTFAYWIANGTAGYQLLDGIDYWQVMREEPSLLEQAVAIFGNTLLLDQDGRPINARAAERRAAQYIYQYMTGELADADWDGWEVELHEPFGGSLG